MSRLEIGSKRRCFRIIEVHHRHLRTGNEVPKKGTQLVERLVVKRYIVHDRHTRLEERNRAVALIDFADENIAIADPGAGKGRAWVDEVLHIGAVHNRWAFSSAMQNPADH